jgi:MarR family transcriptional regulator, organic hydroperoxide resistance regulator
VADREQTINQIMESYEGVSRALVSFTTPNWLELDLTMAQLKALFALAGNDPITVGRLGQMLRIRLPAASHAADSLVRLELAHRYEDSEDRRRTFVQLTPRGQSMVAQLRQGKRDLFRTWLAALADDDRAALLRGLQGITAVIPVPNDTDSNLTE